VIAPISLIVLLTILLSSSAFAEEQSTELSLKQILLMPGELTLAHAHIEAKCQSCHVHFDQADQSPLCLDCHKAINKDIKEDSGHHSFIDADKIKQCSSCHSDHKGREADIRSLDIEQFNHKNTNFELKGGHLEVACNSCHQDKKDDKPSDGFKSFKLDEHSCTSCHEDPHESNLGEDCTSCHNEKNWQETTFDHADSDFPLKGKHEQLVCQACHVSDTSIPIGSECVNCHLGKDKHFTIFGQKCGSCHNEKDWAKSQFDHDKKTDFALLGKHIKVPCSSCHLKSLTPGTDCIDCHKSDDIHLSSNGDKCQSCHNNDSWDKAKFDHNKNSLFPLVGAHSKVNCSSCHLPGEEISTTTSRVCTDCHKNDDAHQGNLGCQCQTCHSQKDWNDSITFDHDFSQFPLTGAHNSLVCETCHLSTEFNELSNSCTDCHSNDDIHDNNFGDKCETCHNSASWSAWFFDHQKQTEFPLDGAHKQLSCQLCHNNQLPQPLPSQVECVECHLNHDPHRGSFGKNCQQCHITESFHDLQF